MATGRALIFSYSDCAHYHAGITQEPVGSTEAAQLLRNPEGKVAKFPSLFRAQQALKDLGYTRGWLVMQSPYDEMIGSEPAQKTELALPFDTDD
ncbi:DUF6482 family protein [Cellvibrio fontiphilus]|uniref:DUF6482 family protein n=1 Tax=Cellvibrio fontiphilus TaxID=1815559 RepID=A0ABV7FEH9_9GAMM